ncbi:MAG: ATP-binding protein [Dehalococcoidia bacterium]|nr:ATP-binding protein [Dehalococcoidia bacterium]
MYYPDWPIGHPKQGTAIDCICVPERKAKRERDRCNKLLEAAQIPNHYAGSSLNTLDVSHPSVKTLKQIALEYVIGWLCELGHDVEEGYEQFCDKKPTLWLAIFGLYGNGKTRVATAITRGFAGHGMAARYAYVPDLLDELRKAQFESTYDDYGNKSGSRFYEVMEELKQVDVLVLDDLGVEKESPWADEQLDKILDYRYRNASWTVLTTNMEITQLAPRIADRIRDREVCTVVINDAPSYRPQNKRPG